MVSGAFLTTKLFSNSRLVEAFITEFSSEYGKSVTGITREALTLLEEAAWYGNIRQLRSTIQTVVALATTDKLESKDFPGIYPKLDEALISIWQTLPSKTQDVIWEALPLKTRQTIMHELSKQTAGVWRNLQTSNMPKTTEQGESLNIENMNLNQILCAVAQKRIEQCTSLREAAESLSIDVRTLQRYKKWKESDDC